MIRAARSLISVVYHMIQALARPRLLRYRQAEMQSFRVLVVDDFASFRECVCGMLRGTQFRVVGQAADGLDAVQKARRCQPDLILLDIGLPKLNGIEAVRRISVVASGSKVVFVSLNDDPEVVKAAFSNGACGYILKSAMNGELLPALAAVLRGEKFLTGRVAPISASTLLLGLDEWLEDARPWPATRVAQTHIAGSPPTW